MYFDFLLIDPVLQILNSMMIKKNQVKLRASVSVIVIKAKTLAYLRTCTKNK